MPEVLAMLAVASPSPSGSPLETTEGGRILVLLAAGVVVFLFVTAIARSMMRAGGD